VIAVLIFGSRDVTDRRPVWTVLNGIAAWRADPAEPIVVTTRIRVSAPHRSGHNGSLSCYQSQHKAHQAHYQLFRHPLDRLGGLIHEYAHAA
jgi:hypothetical protein